MRLGLSAAIPPDIELSGGFSSVTGDLEGAWLRTFLRAGGVDRLRLETSDAGAAPDRYEIELSGGVTNLAVDRA